MPGQGNGAVSQRRLEIGWGNEVLLTALVAAGKEEVDIYGPDRDGSNLEAVVTPAGATEPITYTWAPEPESGQGTVSASYRWALPSVYLLTLKVENCGGAFSATHTITLEVRRQSI